jgi:CHASE2 domain-containing sensor protein
MGAGAADEKETMAGVFLAWLRGFLLVVALLVFDPFGISQAADRLSERIIMAVKAPWLSAPPGREERKLAAAFDRPTRGVDRAGQRAITVVLIDDAFLRRYGESTGTRATWPISRMDQYDLVLEPILDGQPAAMFVDYVFHADTAGGVNDLVDMAKTLQERLEVDPALGATRIMLAERPPRSRTDRRMGCSFRLTEPELLTWRRQGAQAVVGLAETMERVELVATRFWGPSDRYPLAPLAVGEEGEVPEACEPFGPERRLIASPALALFVQWCKRDGNGTRNAYCRAFRAEEKPEQVEASRFSTGLPPAVPPHRGFRPYRHVGDDALTASVPQWLWYPSNVMRNVLFNPKAVQRRGSEAHPCLVVDDKGRLASSVDAVRLRPPGTGEESVAFNRCIAIDTISALDLGRLGGGLSGKAQEGLLKDRLVLVGVDLDGSPDLIFNPVNGQVPGVLLHAAALENLISDGTRRSREAPAGLLGMNMGLVIAILLAAVAAVPMSRVALMWGWTSREAVIGLTLFSVLLPPALALYLYGQSNYAPANWVSAMTAKLTMLGGLSALLAKSDFKGTTEALDRAGKALRAGLEAVRWPAWVAVWSASIAGVMLLAAFPNHLLPFLGKMVWLILVLMATGLALLLAGVLLLSLAARLRGALSRRRNHGKWTHSNGGSE